MAVFEIEANGRRFEVDAPSIEAAMQAFGGPDQMAQRFAAAHDDTSADRPELQAALQDRVPQRGSLIDPLMQGMTFGFSDEIMGGIGGVAGMIGGRPFSEGYERMRDASRGNLEAYRERSPVTAAAAEFAGAVPTAFVPGLGAVRAASLGGRVMGGMATGAAGGALYGAGSAEEGERTEGATRGLVTGMAIGGAVPLAGRAVANVVGSRAGRAAVPSSDQLKQSSQALYDAAEQQGLRIAPQSFGNKINAISHEMRSKGIDPTIHPKSYAALGRLEEAVGGQLDIREVETLRQVLGQVARSNEPAERFMAGRMLSRLDDYMSNLKPQDVVAGDPKAAVGMVREARSLWSRHAKGDVLADLYERAGNRASQFSGSGFENALRTEFRNLIQSPKKLRMFTPEERKAIGRIARGGPLENFLRAAGKFAPTGVVSSALSGGTGFAIGGPAGAVALPAAGFAARQAATELTKRNFRNADALVRAGGKRPFDQAAAQRAQDIADQALAAGGRGSVPGLLDLTQPAPLEITVPVLARR